MTIYNEEKQKYKDTTILDNTYSYPTQTIDNLISGGDTAGSDLSYYISVSGSIKSYYYEIHLQEIDADDLTGIIYQILDFTLSPEGLIYSSITDAQKSLFEAIRTELKNLGIEGLTITDDDIHAIIFSSGSINCKVYFKESINESQKPIQ